MGCGNGTVPRGAFIIAEKAYWVDNEYTTTALEEMYHRLRLAWLLLTNGDLDTSGGHEGADAPAPCQTSTCLWEQAGEFDIDPRYCMMLEYVPIFTPNITQM